MRAGCAHSSTTFCSTRGDFTEGKDKAVRTLLWNFLVNEQGAAAIEYGLLAAGIAVAIIAVVAALGTQLNTTFSTVSTSLK
jgi:pilus assembly protein Flp/PilA